MSSGEPLFPDVDHPSDALYTLTMNVAEGRIDKVAVAVEIERIAKTKG